MSRPLVHDARTPDEFCARVFAGAAGFLLGLALIKFGNPVILDRMVPAPKTGWEFVFSAWPMAWGYGMLALVVIAGLLVLKPGTRAPRWIILLPLAWFVWQLVAASNTVDPRLTRPTVIHFAACLVWFYLGLFALSRVRDLRLFWSFLTLGLAWVLWLGFDQHFGGLEATRQMIREQPNWQELPPDYLKRIDSNRIFSTLVYPNSLAGAILLLLPGAVTVLWAMTARLNNVARGVSVGLLAYGGLACLVWTGSKSGWLIAIAMSVALFCKLPLERRMKVVIAGVTLALGLTAFFLKFQDYFGRGATSVGARFDYWRAAGQIVAAKPLLGSGPGTFSIPYASLKAPESEMTRLVHNDYLEQAADSGVIGFLTYSGFVAGSLALLYRKCKPLSLAFSVWLGCLGWALQGLVEFGLYIPALAWPAFLLMGWLLGTSTNEIDSAVVSP